MVDPKIALAQRTLDFVIKKFGPEQVLKLLLNARGNSKMTSGTVKAAKEQLEKEGVDPATLSGQVTPPSEYTSSTGEFIKNDVALPILGDVLKLAGNVPAIGNSLLGTALQAVHNSNPIDNMVMGDANLGTRIAGAGLAARGGVQKLIADTAANRVYTAADAAKQQDYADRMLKFQMEQRAPGDFYKYQGDILKSTPSSAGRQ